MLALEFVSMLRRRWWVVLAVALVAALTAWFYSQAQPVVYRARTDMVVLTTRADWNLSMYLEARMRAFRSVLLSPALAEAAVQEVGAQLAPGELLAHCHVELDPQEGRIVLEVDDVQPGRAAALANALAGQLQRWVDELNQDQLGVDHIYVHILTKAEPPTVPVAPRTRLNTLAGAVLGALLGLPLALAWALLDDRLRDPAPVQDRLGLPTWSGRPVPSEEAGWQDAGGAWAADGQRLYTWLRFGLPQRADQGEAWQSLALLGLSEGDLPPLLLAGLGAAVAQDGSQVLLVDADFVRPALHQPLSLSPQPALGDFLQQGGQGRLVPQQTALPGLFLLPAGPPLAAAAQPPVMRRLARALPSLTRSAEVVLLRLPPILEAPEALFVAARVDAVVLVGRAGQSRLRQVRRTLERLRQAGVASPGLVLWRPLQH
ncbi:MAG: hypothetical protein JXA37_00540 [Chloroflexia bacterium]|nr:hypothetical protein [Chloroflexia bacterium]